MRLITFHTTTAALIAEARIVDLDKSVKLSPVPTKVSSSCGYALISNLSSNKILDLIEQNIIDVESLYEVTKENEFEKIAEFQ